MNMAIRKLKLYLNRTLFTAFVAALLATGFVSCKPNTGENQTGTLVQADTLITEQEVLDALQAWSDGIVKIGKVYQDSGDYKAAATEHIEKFYNYQDGIVLFKPTLTSEVQFRTDFEGALSYFVAGNEKYHEDHGFAIKPWSAVRWENVGVKLVGNTALAMGNYYFTPAKGGDDVKVEYSFAFIKNSEGQMKIILHDSHLPYKPAEKH
jgi:hypothetical protein